MPAEVTAPPDDHRALWLTRCHGGRYILTYLPPRIARIIGTRHLDAFEAEGEPIAVRYLCEGGIMSQLGLKTPLKPLTPTRVWLSMGFLEAPQLETTPV